MSSIIQIVQNFCYRINQPAPVSVVGVTTPTEQQYLSLFKFIGDNLRNRSYQWPQLKREYYFNTTPGVRRYLLPGDFYRLLESTPWDVTNQVPLYGSISDYNFAIRQFSVVSLQTRKAYRIIGPTNFVTTLAPYQQSSRGYFEIDPAGQDGADQLVLGYMSCNWVWPKNWAPATIYAFGDTVSVNGAFYICTTPGTSGAVRPSTVTDPVPLDGTVGWTVFVGLYQVDDTNTELSDNDICLFDDDLMIEGMRWAYFRAKGQDYEQERSDWEQELKNAFARFNGPTKVNMADEIGSNFWWPNLPVGSWNL